MTPTRVAVLIAAHDRRETTVRALASLQGQRGLDNATVTIVVVDDASHDGTAAAVREAVPDVHLVAGSGSLYWAGATRRADAEIWPSRPDHLLWLNDDVELYPDALATLLAAADATGRGCIVAGAVVDPDTGAVSYGGRVRHDRRRPLATTLVEPDGTLRPVDTMNGNVVLVPRSVRERLGPIDPRFPHNMADLDYGLRARAAGVRVVLAPRPVGSCRSNPAKSSWRDPAVPLRRRLQALTAPTGLPPRPWITFTRRHAGWRWPLFAASPYVRALLARWWR